MNDEAAVTFRAATPDDLPFVQSSWGHSYYSGTQARRFMSPEEFHAFHRPLRDRFFAKPNTTVIVCSAANDPWHIVGWIAVEVLPRAFVLQYIYVKSAFKGEGIARDLIKRAIPSSPVFYTHITERAARIMAAKTKDLSGFRHIPHLV